MCNSENVATVKVFFKISDEYSWQSENCESLEYTLFIVFILYETFFCQQYVPKHLMILLK